MSRLGSGTIALILVCHAMAGTLQPAPWECKSGSVSIPFLTNSEDGWDVSFVKKPKVLKRGPFILADGTDSGLQVVKYEFKKQTIILPRIAVNPCEYTGTFRQLYFVPKQVIGFEKDGHLFAYTVWVQAVSGPGPKAMVIGYNTHVIFYDMHGNGVFDSVRLGAGIGMPLIPDWVKNASEKIAEPSPLKH